MRPPATHRTLYPGRSSHLPRCRPRLPPARPVRPRAPHRHAARRTPRPALERLGPDRRHPGHSPDPAICPRYRPGHQPDQDPQLRTPDRPTPRGHRLPDPPPRPAAPEAAPILGPLDPPEPTKAPPTSLRLQPIPSSCVNDRVELDFIDTCDENWTGILPCDFLCHDDKLPSAHITVHRPPIQ